MSQSAFQKYFLQYFDLTSLALTVFLSPILPSIGGRALMMEDIPLRTEGPTVSYSLDIVQLCVLCSFLFTSLMRAEQVTDL